MYLIKMSLPVIDKVTVLNLVSAFIIMVYVAFMFLKPDSTIPAGLIALANMAITYLFITSGISYGQKLTQKTQ